MNADSPDAPRLPPRRFSPGRRAVVRSIEFALRLLGGRRYYRRAHLGRGRFRVRRERLLIPGLGDGLEGYRIAHLSDLHAGPFLGPGGLRDVLAEVRAASPRLACITGDFITHRFDEAFLLLPDLALLARCWPLLAVVGNHDYRGRREGLLAAAFGAVGVRVLRNSCHRIDTGRGVLAVVGIEDLEESRVIDLSAARSEVRPDDVELVLCHNPGGAERIAGPRCVAVLSGHTHGHQIDLPLVRRAAPRHPGDRVERGGTACVTSRGLGALGVPLRVGSAAELVVLELAGAPGREVAA